MLDLIILSAVLLCVLMLNAVMLSVVFLCVILLSDVVLYAMEQYALENVNKYLNTNVYSYLETSGGQSSNLHLNVVHFFNTGIN